MLVTVNTPKSSSQIGPTECVWGTLPEGFEGGPPCRSGSQSRNVAYLDDASSGKLSGRGWTHGTLERRCQLKQPQREIRPELTVGNPGNLCTGRNRSWCPKRKLDKALDGAHVGLRRPGTHRHDEAYARKIHVRP